MTTATMTVRLEGKLKLRLEKLAHVTHRSKSFLAAQAISEYLKIQEWQLKEIKKGILEAQEGQLVSHKDIVKYWEKRRADSVDERGGA